MEHNSNLATPNTFSEDRPECEHPGCRDIAKKLIEAENRASFAEKALQEIDCSNKIMRNNTDKLTQELNNLSNIDADFKRTVMELLETTQGRMKMAEDKNQVLEEKLSEALRKMDEPIIPRPATLQTRAGELKLRSDEAVKVVAVVTTELNPTNWATLNAVIRKVRKIGRLTSIRL